MLSDGRFPGLRIIASCPSFPEHKVPVEFLGNGSPLTVARAAPDLAKYLLAAPYSLYPNRGHRHPKPYRANFRKTSAFLRFGSKMKLPGTEIGYCDTGGSL